MTVESITVMTV